ncbi:hypothetical protein F66182_6619 [Fusarium sp. NRRL 66182]|nr:hypothetical protein F66182_6619 [Fusarium sp. NRRL 66182]
MNLCNTCKESLDWTSAKTRNQSPGRYDKNHHYTYKDWRLAVERGCSLWFDGPLPFSNDIEIVQTDAINGAVGPRLDLLDTLGSSTGSEATWSLIRQWISACLDKHDCGIRAQDVTPWYPTRLLDLGLQESKGAPRLVETSSDKPISPYVTLSHCWGKGKHIRALRDNLHDLYTGIHSLSTTFEQAVTATRKLGYRYLWIDSLCIVQDDHQDWYREAALMHKVYSNAVCNIAAAASGDSSGGLFFKRDGIHGHCVAQYSREGRVESYIDRNLFLRDIQRSPLQTRAWVEQEWLMARRTIHFAKNQVFWECDQLCACETLPCGLLDRMRYRGKAHFAEALNNATSLQKRKATAESELQMNLGQYLLWTEIVTNYTSRNLTKMSDRLPALSGIAKWLQPHFDNPVYLAGLWNNGNIVRQLAWFSSTLSKPRRAFRAPSWSWASIDTTVYWLTMYGDSVFRTQILAASTTPEGADPTGAVSGGHLVVQGQVSRVKMTQNGIFMAFGQDELSQGQGRVDQAGSLIRFDAEDAGFGEYYALALLSDYTGGSENTPASDTYLILRPLAGKDGTYERCGLAGVWYDEGDQHETPLIRSGSELRQKIPCEEYLGPEEGYKIRIV